MNWLLRKLGYRDNEYRGSDFRVRIEGIFREAVSVNYERAEVHLHLDGERIGKRWQGISVQIPQNVEAQLAAQIAGDLAKAFQALDYTFLVHRSLGMDVVPESERQAALSELRDMGYDIEVSADKRQIRQKIRPGFPRPDPKTSQQQALRMMQLIQTVRGERPRLEILAKSPDI